MIDIKLHTVIDSDDANKMSRFWGFEDEDIVFSVDTLNRILADHPDDNEVRIGIHCDGGSVSEGLAIYDALRMSGKTIYTDIEGGCHSMAVCILLAAPKENRSANPNCRALIHRVSAPVYELYQNADQLRELADQIEREQEAILDIYADRTGTDKDTLRNIMKEEKQRTAQELLDLGFISKINTYTTNKKATKMAKNNSKASLLERFSNFLNSIEGGAVNYDHKDADGNILFSTEREDETIEVGDAASPDGVFTLQDGRTVTITDGVIATIEEPASNEELDNLKAENETLRTENESLKAQIEEATNLLRDARNELQSNYTPAQRQTNAKAGKGAAPAKTAEDYKNELTEKRKMLKA